MSRDRRPERQPSRREIVQWGPAALFAACAIRPPGAEAAAAWLDLKEAVRLDAARVARPWDTAAFDAWLSFGGRDLRLAGEIVRARPDDGTTAGLDAYCTLCPHEICHVELVLDPADVPFDDGTPPDRPLLVCPCHFSTFDPMAGGAPISGPSYRGLYVFDLQRSGAAIHIARVEAGVTALLG